MDIKHTFSYTATFEDGTQIVHDKEGSDASTQFPTGTVFTDVLEKEKESKLVSFVLHNDETSVGVDLQDGHFEINGIPFFQHRPDLLSYKDFRVIYVRTVQRTISQVTGEEVDSGILSYTVGWQTTHNGENIQKTIII